MPPWVRVLAIDSALLVGWLASASAVVLHDRGHVWGNTVNPTTALHTSFGINEQWFGLYYQDQKVGYAQTTLVPEERNGIPGVVLSDRGRFAFTLLGVPQHVELSMRAFIDADWRLQTVEASVHSDAYQLSWSGHREGSRLVLTMSTGESRSTTRLDDPGGGTIVMGLSPWTAFHRLRVGQWGSMWVINPLALKPEQVYFHVRGRERMDGKDALVIETELRGLTTTSWVTPEGDVLREDSPLGWTLVRESMEQALQHASDLPAADLLSTTAVPIDRTFDQPERLTRLVWLLEGASAESLAVSRPWQRLLSPETLSRAHLQPPQGEWCLVELTRPAVSETPSSAFPRSLERYRQPSPFVQSDDPRILAAAREAVGALEDPWPRVTALNRWVYRTLAKRLTVGLPSALDVLNSKSGDCHEHTVLFTALARSLGLPTRMVAGLVYYDGRLFYHAWPEVWLNGSWVPTDPTLGQPVADATHLGLTEAEHEALISIGQFVGKLRVRVLEADEGPE